MFEKAQLTKGYEALDTDEQRAAYKLIDENILYISEEKIDGDYKVNPVNMKGITLSEAELHLIIFAYSMDHPEVFWLQSKFAYYTTGNQTFLQLNSGLSPEEIVLDANKMKNTIDSIFADVTADMSEYDRELEIHNAFLGICEYADHEAETTDPFRIYTSVGALVDGYAVCEGYSRAMQLLLSRFGIDSTTVSGTADGEGHMWNAVNIEGEWYHLDATWNDISGQSISHEYFNITDSEILLDHTFSKNHTEFTSEQLSSGQESFNIIRPACTALDADYFVKRGFFFTPDKMLTLAELLLSEAEAMVEVKFADSEVRDDFVRNYNHYFEELNAEIMLTNPDADFYVGRIAVSSLTMRIYKTEKDSEVSESFSLGIRD